MSTKTNILLIGCGGVGAIAAYNLEAGGLAIVTAVLRSNYNAVERDGFTINSIDHGRISGWRPNQILRAIPDVIAEKLNPYEFIILTTKNTPDINTDFHTLIAPAVTKETSILLLQNGLNIEKPFQQHFPTTIVLSGISLIGAIETNPGHILHDDRDRLTIGSFFPTARGTEAAERFVNLYSASGNVHCEHNPKVREARWRKLVYNAGYNSACAIVGLDTARMRLFGFPIEYVVKPLMEEIVRIAEADGVKLADDVVEQMINVDPIDTYFKPSMLQDVEKRNYIEFENIVGEPLRESERLGVPAPSLRMAYGLLKCLQWKIKEEKGLVSVPKPSVR